MNLITNMVLSGAYKNYAVTSSFTGKLKLKGVRNKVLLDRSTVQSCELINDDSKKSFGSGLVRGTIGGAIFGLPGALAGASSCKTKNEYIVRVKFYDGKQSTIVLDKNYYKLFLLEVW